jgi:hypothetical protein
VEIFIGLLSSFYCQPPDQTPDHPPDPADGGKVQMINNPIKETGNLFHKIYLYRQKRQSICLLKKGRSQSIPGCAGVKTPHWHGKVC